jgi:methylmalonyl-CoA mutase
MTMTMNSTATTREELLGGFAEPDFSDWRRLVESEMKGAPFEKKMYTETYEGVRLQPIYRAEDISGLAHLNSFPGLRPFVRGASACSYSAHPWEVSQEIAVPSASAFNEAARNSLGRGLNALNVVVDRATRNGQDPDWAKSGEVGLGGLSIATLDDLGHALEGVDLDRTSLFIRSGASALPFAALLVALVQRRRQSPASLKGCIEMDPLGVLAHEGRLPQSLAQAYREMAALTRWAGTNAPSLRTICIHSRAWHEGGGSAVEELAFTLATALEYLRRMDEHGLPVERVAPRIRFAVTVGEQFFTEIAKIRALRMLWSRIVASLGGGECSQRISLHIRTSLWNKTAVDPYNNLLRATVESFAAVIGGCDSLQVGSFDEVVRRPDDFSQRIARNTQLVLQKECQLTSVIDPAGGSWFVESLTAEIAKRAWSQFQDVERMGGMHAAMEKGAPQRAVAATAEKKLKAVARRRDSVIGVNQYANPREKPLAAQAPADDSFHRRRAQQVASHRVALDGQASSFVLGTLSRIVGIREEDLFEACVDGVAAGATLGEITRAIRIQDAPAAPVAPVGLTRASAAFERLRAAMDRQPEPAKVFLCNMGPLKEHKARADFARGFFSVGGFDVVSPAGFATPDEAAEAFAASGARIAVICSIDDKYPALVPPLAAALRSKRADTVIVLAGYPADQVDAHGRSGVNEFIHLRADALEVLSKIQSQLGIA